MENDTLQKIEAMRALAEGKDPDTIRLLDGARTIFKKAQVKRELGKHPGFTMLQEAWQRRLTGVMGLLANDENLSQEDRKKLFGRKQELEFNLKFFSVAERNIEVIHKEIASKANQFGV